MKESYRQKPLLTLAAGVAAMALLLAGCGGGSSSPPPMPDPPPPMPDPTPPGPTAESIKADAADAVTAALAASMAAEQAKKDAIKYAGMLTAMKVNGDSAMAEANAQMVLDAEMAANNAVMDADDALQDAMAAKEAAEALPADDADRASAIAVAERAIEQATAQKKAAMAVVDTAEATEDPPVLDSLKGAVEMVKGDNPLLDSYPRMPAAFAKVVAGQVSTAIGTAAQATNTASIPAGTHMGGIKNDAADIGAMTWAMIVGESSVMDVRRLVSGAVSTVKAMSVMGSMASDLATATATLPTDDDPAKDGIQNNDGANYDAAYMGIDGTVFCAGNDCGQSAAEDGNLTGSWYFTPDNPDELFVASTGGSYMMATMYATYGYWLTYNAQGEATGVALHTASTANTGSLDLGQAGTGDDATDVTATYRGSAVGISARGDASGQFTADVNLTAKFAVAPTLRGSISNFQGNAVGNWSILLNETTLGTDAALSATGTTAGGGSPGVWTAQGYGPEPVDPDGPTGPITDLVNQRPTGFFGRFSASFGDGSAAGAYTTRAVE